MGEDVICAWVCYEGEFGNTKRIPCDPTIDGVMDAQCAAMEDAISVEPDGLRIEATPIGFRALCDDVERSGTTIVRDIEKHGAFVATSRNHVADIRGVPVYVVDNA